MPPATPSQSFDTPSIPASDAVFIAHSTTQISAPASLVFRTLRNTETWRDWNPWVPRVVVTYQTPDDDTATAEEIAELVRNTSIAGSYDSDLTDGIVGGGVAKRRSAESDRPPDTPPLKLRSKSNASAFSDAPMGRSNSQASEILPNMSSNPQNLTIPTQTNPKINGNSSSNNNNNESGGGEVKLSAAQKYAAAQESRRSSVKSGEMLPEVSGNALVHDPFLSPSSFRSQSSSAAVAEHNKNDGGGSSNNNDGIGSQPISPRRKSILAIERARQKSNEKMLLQLYGEPSVRIQLNTKMTFFIRMNPRNKGDYKQQHIVVTHVSRPDDPSTDGNGKGEEITALTRSKTHTLSDTPADGTSPVYRIVWTLDSSKSSLAAIKNGSSYPKSLFQAERVHEIRPLPSTLNISGNNNSTATVERCEYRSWECQKGPMAKLVVKKKLTSYVQTMFERWGSGLGEFCEGLVGNNVERRDFSVDLSEAGTTTGGGAMVLPPIMAMAGARDNNINDVHASIPAAVISNVDPVGANTTTTTSTNANIPTIKETLA